MIKYLVALPLIFHGLANLGGAFAPWLKEMQGFKDAPWIFSNIKFKSALGRSFSLLWLASTICLVAAGVGLLMGQSWWASVGIAGCICSCLSILPWWKAVVPGAYVGAVFDVIAIIVLVSPLKEQILPALP